MSTEPCIPCRAMVELVTDYFEGALPEADRVRFESHISACGHCAAYVEQMRVTLRVVGHLGPGDLDPEVERGLLEVFRAWKGEQA
ncbi:MAG TPA: zf-HC2 domain-containing protein [Baekduia sp.]|nr:zf-HC2 domain-containing protein [Baekduia sp.]